MKNRFTTLLFIILLIVGGKTTSFGKKSLSVKNSHHSGKYYYHSYNEKDGVIDIGPKDSAFYIDHSRVLLSVSIFAKGDYAYIDTICVDSCEILSYKNRYVHIYLKSKENKEVVITKEFIANSIKGMSFSKCVLGLTSIDTIEKGEKKIIFSTELLGDLPKTDLSVQYSVGLNGDLKFIKLYQNDGPGE